MKYIKKFEYKKDLSKVNVKHFYEKFDEISMYYEKLDEIAIYLEYKLGISHNDGFIHCTWSDIDYEDNGYIYFEFDFLDDVYISGEFDEIIHNFLLQYDKDYQFKHEKQRHQYYNEGHDLYTIKLNSNDIREIYKDAEVYHQSKKYNL